MAEVYTGRVLDEQGEPIGYATVYLEENPVIGTATGMDGVFHLETDVDARKPVIISFMGYMKKRVSLAYFRGEGMDVTLREQPIALEEMVISAKPGKQRNKRKELSQVLYKVYNRMQFDFPQQNYEVKLVSDVKMDSQNTPWGMEQMIADVKVAPGKAQEGRDSVQFKGEYCKRFFQGFLRNRADSVLAGDNLDKRTRRMAVEMDSGVVVHRSLWAIGNVRYDFEEDMKDLKNWTISRESETETVLTHRAHKNYIGIVKYEYLRHYIVDSETYELKRFSMEMSMQVSIPFGYKLKPGELELLNMINMDEQQINKFRLRRADARVRVNTLYIKEGGHLYPQERNMETTALLTSTKKQDLPIKIKATQRVTQLQTNGVQLWNRTPSKRIRRENVTIY